jgi:hypothetical protein
MRGAPAAGRFRNPRRVAVLAAIAALAALPGDMGRLARATLQDAWLGVAVFVALTLLLTYGTERVFDVSLGTALQRLRRLQVPAAAFMGMLPGCAGAVMVTAAYAAGQASMGALVAALTATMGDAAFLLIATRPDVAAVLLPLAFVTGAVSGHVIDAMGVGGRARRGDGARLCEITPRIGAIRARDLLFGLLALPGLVLGLLAALQIGLAGWLAAGATTLSLAGMAVTLAIWAASPMRALSNPADAPLTRMTEETAFISVWVVVAFLGYGISETVLGFDLAALFHGFGLFLPLIGIAIGFIPGCAPQVVVVTLYLNGLVPFAALLGNALSNDGDALFPAFVLAPRAAVQATALSAVPALLLAYGFYLFAPGFMN